MKKIIALIFAIALAFAMIFISCEQNNERPEFPSYLPNGAELAQQHGGLYFKEGRVSMKKDTDNGQERLQIVLTNGGIKPHTVNVFLEKKDWNSLQIKSGDFEVLYLKHLIVLNEPQTGLRYTFSVASEELLKLEAGLPSSYFSNSAVEAIGIAFQGPLPTLKGNPENVAEVCHYSGGTGSSSCSNACCSITCKTGYYATCGNSCNCTKDE